MTQTTKIPTTVITGFLGAGKTTLIRSLLEQADRRIALIVNEFGDVGVDGTILSDCGDEACSADDVVELANGCICCTVADDFIPTMTALIERDAPPDHIIIETSGLALPQPLVRAFNWPQIRTRVTVDSVVTVVDAAAVASGGVASDTDALERQRRADAALDHEKAIEELFEDQLKAADLVVLTKSDLIDTARTDAVASRLGGETREGVPVVSAVRGSIPIGALLGLEAQAEADLQSRRGHHDHDHDHDDEDHDHDHGHDAFSSVVVDLPEFTDEAALREAATRMIAEHGLLRLKGFAAIRGKDMRLVLQAVGPRIETYYDRAFAAGEPRVTRLVAIGMAGLEESALAGAGRNAA